MFAVLQTGGKQYRVEPGSVLTVEKIGGEPGSSVTFDRVLLVGDDDSVTVGTPTVPGAWVSATVVGEALGPKLVVFKFKQKVKYRRRTGHRQHLTQLRIDSISADGRKVEAEAPSPEKALDAAPKAAPTRGRRTRTAAAAVAEAKEPPPPRAAARTPRAATRAPEGPASEGTEEVSEAPAKPARTRRARGTSPETAPSDSEARQKPTRTRKPKTESAKE